MGEVSQSKKFGIFIPLLKIVEKDNCSGIFGYSIARFLSSINMPCSR